MKLGILGAGFIAHVMADTVEKLQAAGDRTVELYAVAARDAARAGDFARQYGMPRAYGSYEEMLRDPAVELVYIATPHSHHYRHIRLCVDHGKAVLCEKPFTVNARQAADVLAYARAKGVLVTEAIWTRYQPMRRMLDEVVRSGAIGQPRLLTANLGYAMLDKPRIVDPALAGGALLDVGVYALNFAEMVFGPADGIQGLCTKHTTGVDLTDSITLTWADGKAAHLTAAANAVTDRHGAVYGSEGCLMVENINNPQKITVFDTQGHPVREIPCPAQHTGYEYELLEAARCLAEGRLECPSMPHSETVHMMEVMDHLRAQMGIRYPCEGLD